MDITKFLKTLKAGMAIPEEFAFLKKYDLNQNSIFDSDEIETLQDAFVKNGKLTSVENVMAKPEKFEEYQKLSDVRKECVKVFVQNTWRFNADEIGYYDLDFFTGYFSEDIFPEDEIKDYLKSFKELNRIPSMSFMDVTFEQLKKLKNVSSERVDYLIENKLYNSFTNGCESIAGILLFDDEDFEKSKKFFELDGLETKPDIRDLRVLIGYSQSYEILSDMVSTLGVKHVSPTVIEFAKSSLEEYEQIKKITETEVKMQDGSSCYIHLYDALPFSRITEEERLRAYDLLHIDGRKPDSQIDVYDVCLLAKCTHKDFQEFIKANPDFQIVFKNETCKTFTLTRDGDDRSIEYVFDFNDGLIETRKKEGSKLVVENTRNRIHHEVNYSEEKQVESETLTYYDEAGKVIKTVNLSQGSMASVPNRSVTYADGRVEPVQFASETDGVRTIIKDFVSPDGTKTEYYFEETPDNIHIIKYKITDKDGNVLMDRLNTFHQVSENHFVSSVNGHVYDVEFEEDKICVQDGDKETVINLNGLVYEDDREAIIGILKNVPGNQLILMTKLPLAQLDYRDRGEWVDNGVWKPDEQTIIIGKQNSFSTTEANLLQAVFMHEMGHFIDTDEADYLKEVISCKENILEIFREEVENMRHDTTSAVQGEINYFLNNTMSDPDLERVAEANMLLYAKEPARGMRVMYFQQYFPKTIAAICEAISQREKELIGE